MYKYQYIIYIYIYNIYIYLCYIYLKVDTYNFQSRHLVHYNLVTKAFF